MAKDVKLTKKHPNFTNTDANEHIVGSGGKNTVHGLGGHDTFDGKGGKDTLVIDANWADAKITETDDGFKIKIGSDWIKVTNVEKFKFADGTLNAEQLINDAPTGSATKTLAVGTEDVAYTLNTADLTTGFKDQDSDTLKVTNLVADHGTVKDNGDGTFTITQDKDFNGVVTLTYKVDDGRGGSADATNTFTVAPVNDAPVVANPIADQTGLEGTPLTFTLPADAFKDVDGDHLVYTASLDGGFGNIPAWLTFDSSTGTFSGTPGPDDAGIYNIRVTASDGTLSTFDVFTLTIGDVFQTLTPATDTVVGSTADDQITGDVADLTTFDNVDGKDGNDTLSLGSTSAGDITINTLAKVANVENFNLTDATGNITADLSAWTGLQSVVIAQGDDSSGSNLDIDTKSNVTSVSISVGTSNTTDSIDITDGGTAATDKLASVSLTGTDHDNVTLHSDALTSLSLTSVDDASITIDNAVSHALALSLNKSGDSASTDNFVEDDTATSLAITATGEADVSKQQLTLDVGAATTITVGGDGALTITGASNISAVTSFDASANTGGVALLEGLNSDANFKGGSGDDSLQVDGALNVKATYSGGEGTDTLVMQTGVADLLSSTKAFGDQVDSFEAIELTDQVAAGNFNQVDLDMLDKASTVIVDQGPQAGPGAPEVATITFEALLSGQTVSFAGRTVTANGGDLTATQVADAFENGVNSGNAVVGGTLDSTYSATTFDNGNTTTTLVANSNGDQADLAPAFVINAPVNVPTDSAVQGVTGVTAVKEVFTVDFGNNAKGADTIAFDGKTVTLADGDNANAIAAAFAGTTFNTWDIVNNFDGSVTFTSKAAGARTDTTDANFVITDTGGDGHPTVTVNPPSTQGVDGVAAVTETHTITFGTLLHGQSVTVAGRTITATSGDLTAIQVADAFENGGGVGASSSGTLTGYTVAAVNGNNTSVLTATGSGNVADPVISTGQPAVVTPNHVITDGDFTSGGGELDLNNFVNGGKLTLHDSIGGDLFVNVKDAVTTAGDSVNVLLAASNGLYGNGTLHIHDVSTLAFTTKDTDTVAPTSNWGLDVRADEATSITVSGVQGVNFLVNGNWFNSLTSFDASGVTGDSAHGGDVSVGSNVTTGVTLTGGAGNDDLESNSAALKVDKLSGGAGNDWLDSWNGNDILDGGTGDDDLWGHAGADTLTGGTGKDTFHFNNGDSAGALADTITDFVSGVDTLDFNNIFGGFGTYGGEVTSLAQANTTLGGSVVAVLNSATHELYVDTNGDGDFSAGDLLINLTGITKLSATTDFTF